MHGRNLDFPLWNQFSRLLVSLDVYRSGAKIAEWDAFVGYLNILSGVKPGQYAMTVDTRHTHLFKKG